MSTSHSQPHSLTSRHSNAAPNHHHHHHHHHHPPKHQHQHQHQHQLTHQSSYHQGPPVVAGPSSTSTTSTAAPMSVPPQQQGGDDQSASSSDFQSDDDYAWIPWFCSLKGNEFFCEVEDSYAQDSFNLTGLNAQVPYYDYALDMILDIEPNDILSDDQQEMVDNDAENLFGLIHARYILTNRGLQAMLEKYRQGHFGRCPRVLCKGQATLPCGVSDTTNEESVKLYCPRCEELYNSKSSRHEHIDGAYFGTTFPHLFFLTFPELKVPKTKEVYIPRVFGFRVNKNAYKKSLEARKKQNTSKDKNTKTKYITLEE